MWGAEDDLNEATSGAGGGAGDGGRVGSGDEEVGPEITGELDPNAQAELIAARVQRDMSIVRELLDSTHTKLSEMDLFAVKNARSLNLRVDETNDRTKNYDHEQQEYEIGRLNRVAEEQERRLVELNEVLVTQTKEMERRDHMLAEQTAMLLESSQSIKLFETVLSKKQRALLTKKRLSFSNGEREEMGGDEEGEGEEGVDGGDGGEEREEDVGGSGNVVASE